MSDRLYGSTSVWRTRRHVHARFPRRRNLRIKSGKSLRKWLDTPLHDGFVFWEQKMTFMMTIRGNFCRRPLETYTQEGPETYKSVWIYSHDTHSQMSHHYFQTRRLQKHLRSFTKISPLFFLFFVLLCREILRPQRVANMAASFGGHN